MRLVLLSILVAAGLSSSLSVYAYDGLCDSAQDVTELPPRHWCEVPNSQLRAVEKKPSEFSDWNGSSSDMYSSFQRVMGIEAVTRAWNSAAMDPNRSCLMVLGGGHNDYGGNEVYRFCLRTLKWERITDPTPFPNRHPAFQNSDGTPVSRHTYGGVSFLSNVDKLFIFDGSPDDGPGTCGVRGTWTFDIAERDMVGKYSPSHWRLRTSENEPERQCDNASVYDPVSGLMYFKTTAGTYTFDISTDSWNQVSSAGRRNQKVTLAIDRRNRVLAEVGGGITALWQLDDALAGGVVATTGSKEIEDGDDPGLVYDPRAQKIVAWNGGASVYTFDSQSRVWTEIRPANTNTGDPGAATTSGGVFGRFNYAEDANVYIYVDRVSENVYLYRLTAEDAPPTPRAPSEFNAQ